MKTVIALGILLLQASLATAQEPSAVFRIGLIGTYGLAMTRSYWQFEGGCDCIASENGYGPAYELGVAATLDLGTQPSPGLRLYGAITSSTILADDYIDAPPVQSIDIQTGRVITSRVRFVNRIDLHSIGVTAGVAIPIDDGVHIGAGIRYDHLTSSVHEQRLELYEPPGATLNRSGNPGGVYSDDGRTYYCRVARPLDDALDSWISFEPKISWTIDVDRISIIPQIAWRLPLTEFSQRSRATVSVVHVGLSLMVRLYMDT